MELLCLKITGAKLVDITIINIGEVKWKLSTSEIMKRVAITHRKKRCQKSMENNKGLLF